MLRVAQAVVSATCIRKSGRSSNCNRNDMSNANRLINPKYGVMYAKLRVGCFPSGCFSSFRLLPHVRRS